VAMFIVDRRPKVAQFGNMASPLWLRPAPRDGRSRKAAAICQGEFWPTLRAFRRRLDQAGQRVLQDSSVMRRP